MDKRLERILPRVQKPARYTGGEYNQIIKDKTKVDIRLAFCFPDTYEIGIWAIMVYKDKKGEGKDDM